MTQEARLAAASSRSATSSPAGHGGPGGAGPDPQRLPALHGYVRVSPKPGSETVLTSDQDEVVLSEWQFDWGGPCVDGGRRGGVVAGLGLVRGVQAPLAPGRALDDGRPQHARDPGGAAWHREGATIRVESFDAPGQYRNHLQTVAEVAFPDGTGQRVPVPQTAPGRYEGAFALDRPGVYFVQLTQTDPGNGRLVARQTTGYALPHLPEYAVNPANRVLLERLAADTGGPSARSGGGLGPAVALRLAPPTPVAGAAGRGPGALRGRRRRAPPAPLPARSGLPAPVPALPAPASAPSAVALRRRPARPAGFRPRLPRFPGPASRLRLRYYARPAGARPLRTGYNEPDLVERRPSFARRWWFPSRWPQPAWCCSARS